MEEFLDLINSDLGRKVIAGVSQQTDTAPDKTASALSMVMPLIIGGMHKNMATPKGAEGLLGSLSGKHDGSILDDLSSLFKGGVDQSVIDDGARILGHVLGGKQQNIENVLSQKTGLDASTVSQIIKIAAPIIMGYLGRQQRTRGVSNTGDLKGLLESVMGAQQSAAADQNLLEQLIDADGDGSIIDDIAGMALGSQQKKGGLGGLIGGLFDK